MQRGALRPLPSVMWSGLKAVWPRNSCNITWLAKLTLKKTLLHPESDLPSNTRKISFQIRFSEFN
jgi:hypothetical protein